MKGQSRNLFRLTGLPVCTAIGLIATAAHAKSTQPETSKLSNPALDQALAIECTDFLSSSPSRMAVARMAVQTAEKAESAAVDANALTNATASKTAASTQMKSIAGDLAAPEAMKGVVNASSSTLEAVSKEAAKASTALSAAMRAIRKFETDIETGGLADNDTVFNGNLDRAVEARKKLANCAKRNFEAAKKAEEAARVAAPESAEAKTAKMNLEEAQKDYIKIAQRSIFDQAQLSLLVGPSFTINGSDKFNTGAEISALFDGGAGSFLNFGRVITEFSYKTTGTVDTTNSDTGEAQPIDAAALIRNNPGLIRFNSGFSTTLLDRYSAAITGGLSTIPGGGGSAPKPLRPHGQIALLGRTFLSDGVYSRLSVGYAFDRYWINKTPFDAGNGMTGVRTEKSYNRAVVEGLVFLTNPAAAGGITASGRLTINTPLDGDGPAEVRLSILAAMNFLEFFDKLNPVK